MTTAPGFTIAPEITRGRPTSATRMSARRCLRPYEMPGKATGITPTCSSLPAHGAESLSPSS